MSIHHTSGTHTRQRHTTRQSHAVVLQSCRGPEDATDSSFTKRERIKKARLDTPRCATEIIADVAHAWLRPVFLIETLSKFVTSRVGADGGATKSLNNRKAPKGNGPWPSRHCTHRTPIYLELYLPIPFHNHTHAGRAGYAAHRPTQVPPLGAPLSA